MNAFQLPANYQQVIARGTIASVDNPAYVGAEEAEIADNAWVLGVVLNGQERAYSLTLLNSIEIINDRIGQLSFSAVW